MHTIGYGALDRGHQRHYIVQYVSGDLVQIDPVHPRYKGYEKLLAGHHQGKVRVVEPSREGKVRLCMMLWYEAHERNAALTCRRFGVSRDTFYRWRRRYEESGVGGLEDGSHRPKQVRKPTWAKDLEMAVLELRLLTPGWGKDKLTVLLREQGWQCSTSMVGRILRQLKARGRLVEAIGSQHRYRRRQLARSYGVRKPKTYLADGPGAIVQVDTVHVSLFSRLTVKHFTACEVFTRWQVLEAHGRATAHAAAGFLDTIVERMPFPVRAIQVDGGSEFMAEFEDACRNRGILLFVLPPRSPNSWMSPSVLRSLPRLSLIDNSSFTR